MTDLVKHLRSPPTGYDDTYYAELCNDAAAEIERLHRDRIAGEAVITKLSFALKRGNADLRSAKMALQPEQSRHAKARQEINRLRTALRDVLSAFSFWQTLDPAGPVDADETGRFVADIEAAIARARAALGDCK